MCVAVGMAESESVVFAVLVLPCASKVHLPSGPRKSGILMKEISELERFHGGNSNPAEVDMPAPVKTTKCLLLRISATNLST